MQRSITYPFYIKAIALFLLFVIYESMSSIYLFLPPLLGVIFFYFIRALDKQDIALLLLVVTLALVYEAEKGYLLLSSLVYFSFTYKFIIPKLRQVIECHRCMDFLYIILAYIGFWLFTLLMQKIFWIELASMDWSVVWYILAEFMIVGLL